MFFYSFIKRSIYIAIVYAALFTSVWAYAETEVIEGVGTYTIGDGLDENISVAKERAKAEALRNASEKAGTFVESLSVVKESMLTKDEIRIFSANVMEIQGTPTFKIIPISDDVIRYECKVVVTVNTDNINSEVLGDKLALKEAADRNKELEGEIARLNKEMAELKLKYISAATEAEKRAIRHEVKVNDAGFLAARLNEQGAKLIDEGKYSEAIAVFTDALNKNPNFAYAYHNRGIAYGKLKEYAKAVEDFTIAVAINPNYATAYGGRGFAYYGLNEYENAARDFTKAITLNPAYAEAYYGRGNVYTILGHYNEALRDYEKSLSINPNLDAAKANMDMIMKTL